MPRGVKGGRRQKPLSVLFPPDRPRLVPRTVYLTPDQADCVDRAVTERGGSCSDFLREAALFEARHGLARLAWRGDWGWQSNGETFDRDRVFAEHVRRLFSRRTPPILPGPVSATGPAEPLLPLPSPLPLLSPPPGNPVAAVPPPPDEPAMAVPAPATPPLPVSPVVEAVTPGLAFPAPVLPAPISVAAVPSPVRAPIVAAARQRTIAPPLRPPSIDMIVIAKKVGGGVVLGGAIFIGLLHSIGRRDGATWRHPEGPTFGGFMAALVMAAMIPFNLPMDKGRGYLGYALADGAYLFRSNTTDVIADVVSRSPPDQQQIVRYGLMVSGQPGNIDRIQHCVGRLKHPGSSRLCAIKVTSPKAAS